MGTFNMIALGLFLIAPIALLILIAVGRAMSKDDGLDRNLHTRYYRQVPRDYDSPRFGQCVDVTSGCSGGRYITTRAGGRNSGDANLTREMQAEERSKWDRRTQEHVEWQRRNSWRHEEHNFRIIEHEELPSGRENVPHAKFEFNTGARGKQPCLPEGERSEPIEVKYVHQLDHLKVRK